MPVAMPSTGTDVRMSTMSATAAMSTAIAPKNANTNTSLSLNGSRTTGYSEMSAEPSKIAGYSSVCIPGTASIVAVSVSPAAVGLVWSGTCVVESKSKPPCAWAIRGSGNVAVGVSAAGADGMATVGLSPVGVAHVGSGMARRGVISRVARSARSDTSGRPRPGPSSRTCANSAGGSGDDVIFSASVRLVTPANEWPQSWQNFCSASTTWPHDGQYMATTVRDRARERRRFAGRGGGSSLADCFP